MKQITAYQSKDGQIFETMEDALRRDARYDLEVWYWENALFGNEETGKVNVGALGIWLDTNREVIMRYLEATKTS